MTNHVFQCNKYQERIKDIKSGKIMIFYNDSICKVIVFLCKIKMKVTGFFGILSITGHIFTMFWQLELQLSNGVTNLCRVVKSSGLPVKIAAYLVSIGWLLCLAFLYGLHFISLDWPLALTTQQSSLKLSPNLPLGFGYQCKHFRP